MLNFNLLSFNAKVIITYGMYLFRNINSVIFMDNYIICNYSITSIVRMSSLSAALSPLVKALPFDMLTRVATAECKKWPHFSAHSLMPPPSWPLAMSLWLLIRHKSWQCRHSPANLSQNSLWGSQFRHGSTELANVTNMDMHRTNMCMFLVNMNLYFINMSMCNMDIHALYVPQVC